MVQNAEWGPPLWRILHTAAERLGRQASPLIQTDETRCWIGLLDRVEAIMPCALCRGHYKTWKAARPLGALEGRGGTWLRQASRDWLWALHNAVNVRRDLSGAALVPFEAVEGLYAARSPMDFQRDVETLVKVLQRAVLERQINGAYLTEWRRTLAILRKFIGV